MSRTSRIRLGIVGCGRVAEYSHIPAALVASNVELVALADSNSERLDSLVRTYRLSCLATTSHTDLMGKVDAVVLPLPNHLHYPVASEFLSAGVHVLCEKPLASTTRESRLLCESAENERLILAVGYMKRFEPNFELTKRLIDDAFLGKLDHFVFEYGSAGGWAPLSNYNLQRTQAGGGVLVTNGSHLLDRMLCWFGYPSRVTFSDDAHGGVEANCSAIFGFDSGLTGEIRLSKTRPLRNWFRLTGQRGCLVIESSQHHSVSFFPTDRNTLQHDISEHPRRDRLTDLDYFRLQLEDFARAIQSGTPPRVSGWDALASVRLIEQCYQSRTSLTEPWVFDSLPLLERRGLSILASSVQEEAEFGGAAIHTANTCRGSDEPDGRSPRSSLRLPRRVDDGTHRRPVVLITGGNGFVGSRLCEVLHWSNSYEPRPWVHSPGRASYIARYPLHFAVGDLTDLSTTRSAIQGCSMVVHLARGTNDVMIRGLDNILRAAVEAKVQRFVHVSSVAVYGDNPPASARWESASTRKTGNPYGDIKLEQERLVASYGRRFRLPFVILRPPHIVGPYSHFVDAVSQRLLSGVLPIVDGGLNVCNLVYIDNFIEAVLLALEQDMAVGETFFVTDKERVTWRKCLEDFGAILGVDVPHATASQLDPPRRVTPRESLRKLSRVLLSSEVRSALMEVPAVGAVGKALYRGYAALPERHRTYIRSRLAPRLSPFSASNGPRRYQADDYLIVSQRRTVVHAFEKAERILGYTAPVGYTEAMAITRQWWEAMTTERSICSSRLLTVEPAV